MTIVLVVVIVVLLLVLGTGVVITARHREIERGSGGGTATALRQAREPLEGDGGDARAEAERVEAALDALAATREAIGQVPDLDGAASPPAGAGTATSEAGSEAAPAAEGAAAQGAAEPELAPAAEAEPAAQAAAELAPAAEVGVAAEAAAEPEVVLEPEPEVLAAPSFRDRLAKTRNALSSSLGALRGRRRLDERTLEDLEEALILADVGLPTTKRLIEELQARAAERRGDDGEELSAALKQVVAAIFEGDDQSLRLEADATNVWLFVGVNGVGKTTTIGKLAAREVAAGRHVVLGAGDTFRAAAADQLDLWAQRSGASIVRGAEGADPSSVIFDAVQHAAARHAELVLADSAGRLHTKVNLMEELRKVRRIADRPPGHVTEVLLVLDATTGQNGLVQARQFTEAVEVTGVVLTKLDGTAKGGVVLAIRAELGLPIKLVGLGEGVADLVEFDPVEFADALFG